MEFFSEFLKRKGGPSSKFVENHKGGPLRFRYKFTLYREQTTNAFRIENDTKVSTPRHRVIVREREKQKNQVEKCA